MQTEDNGLTIGPSLDTLVDDFNSEGFYEHNANPAPTPEPAPAPEAKLFAGKYKTAEDMEAAYVALSKKLGAPKAEAPTAKAAPAEPTAEEVAAAEAAAAAEAEADALLTPEELEAKTAAKEAEAAKAAEAAPTVMDVEALTTEYTENGELSEESLASLEKLGVTADVAGLFFQGVEAIKSIRTAEVTAVAGSQEELSAIVAWGTANMDEASQKAFNDAVDSAVLQGDLAAIKLIIPAIKQQMASTEPKYVAAVNGQPEASGGYASQAEMAADMRDPRYGRDPAFVAQVQNRLRVTTAF
jgi:hypothetical protein